MVVTVRQYDSVDRSRIEQICCDCGFLGRPIDPIFCDRELFARLYALPYLDSEPENAFVAEVDGTVVGYVLSETSEESRIRRKRSNLRTVMEMLSRLVKGRYDFHSRTKEHIYNLLVRRFFERAEFPSKLIATRHNNILDGYGQQGIGSLLLDRFESRLKELGISGYFVGGIDTLVRKNFNESHGMRFHSRARTTIFKREFPERELYHVCYYKYF